MIMPIISQAKREKEKNYNIVTKVQIYLDKLATAQLYHRPLEASGSSGWRQFSQCTGLEVQKSI